MIAAMFRRLLKTPMLRLRDFILVIDRITVEDCVKSLRMPSTLTPKSRKTVLSTTGDILTFIALLVACIGALLAIVGAWYTKKESDIKEEQANNKIAELKTRSDEARAIAALASEGQAKANETIAGLTLELEKTRLAMAKLKEPRNLSPLEIKQLTELLKHAPRGKVIVQGAFPDTEATHFADQIKTMLSELGYEIMPDTLQMFSIGPPGGSVYVNNPEAAPPHVAPVQLAFDKIGYRFVGFKAPNQFLGLSNKDRVAWKLPDDAFVLWISNKL